MPKRILPLTALEIKRLNKPGTHAVGSEPGLCIRVTNSGSKHWILRCLDESKTRRHIGLGSYPVVTLKAATEKARAIRAELAEGQPLKQLTHKRKTAESMTVRKLVEKYRAKMIAQYKPTSRVKQTQRLDGQMNNYVLPTLGDMPVDQVTPEDLVKILLPIWETKHPTADRLRVTLKGLFNTAIPLKIITKNPADWETQLKHLLPDAKHTKRKAGHYASMRYQDLPSFMSQLLLEPRMSRLCLAFSILTCARSSEVRFACWQEISLQDRTWSIPADRMKATRDHTVPLSSQAMQILEQTPRMKGTDLIFPGLRNKRLSENTLTQVIQRSAKLTVTQHGFRSTFKEWARLQHEFPDEISELCLAHVNDDKTRVAYARSDLLEVRRVLMQKYSDYACSRWVGDITD